MVTAKGEGDKCRVNRSLPFMERPLTGAEELVPATEVAIVRRWCHARPTDDVTARGDSHKGRGASHRVIDRACNGNAGADHDRADEAERGSRPGRGRP